MCQLVKNLLNSMKEQGGKPGDSINEKLPKLDEETKRKTDLVYCFVEGENPPKPS